MWAPRRRLFENAVRCFSCRRTAAGQLAGAIAGLLLVTFLAGGQQSRAEEPDLMQTLIGEDVTLNNNLIPLAVNWQSSHEGRFLILGFGAEKQLSERLGMTITGEYDISSPRQGRGSADPGNVDFQLKYVFPGFRERSYTFALASDVSLPTRSHPGGEPAYVQTEVALAWGARLARLPARGLAGYLRALEIQGDIGYSRAFDSKGSGGLFFDPLIDYSMPYLNYIEGGKVPLVLRYYCPFLELNLYQSMGSGAYGRSELFIMPGLTFLADAFQVSAGTQIALDHETARNTQFAVVGSILIFLDAIDSRFAWLPF